MWVYGHGVKMRARKGFALPTILIASTVMLIVMGTALVSVSSTVLVSLESRHYSTYAKNAAQSGMAMAQACLRQSNYEPQWTDAAPLRPNTNCSGVTQSGVSEYLRNTPEVRVTFTVPGATELGNGAQRISVDAVSERLGTQSGDVWRTYRDAAYATVSAEATFSSVTFGYVGTNGAFFGVVDPAGQVSTVGYNQNGQLGNGTTINATVPQTFGVPSGVYVTQLYSSLLSGGNALFAVASDGRLFGAGANGVGQLGNDAIAGSQSTPVQFRLPNGVRAEFVSVGATNTYVIGSDHNIYAAGACLMGALGTNYAITGCSNVRTPARVNLPTPNESVPATLPVATSDWVQATNIVNDANTAYVRMQGGQVYGWGANESGQLGDGTIAHKSSPVRIGTFGNAGQPSITQLATDGKSLWMLDSNGEVWATGSNAYGALGTPTTLASVGSTTRCITNTNNLTTDQQLTLQDCSAFSDNRSVFEWSADGTLKTRPNTSTERCAQITGSSGSADGTAIVTATCNASNARQQWFMTDDNQIRNPTTNKCIRTSGTNAGATMALYTCAVTSNMRWNMANRTTPAKVVLPTGLTVRRITADQYATLFLMSDNSVWGVGFNTAGQLGNGGNRKLNPGLTRMTLPGGSNAVDVYTTKSGDDSATQFANTYVILSDGSVWGTGANTFGQLGNGPASPTNVLTPVRMSLPVGVRAETVQTGFGTTVVLSDEGRIYTLGNNANGQLGDGTTTNSSVPTARQYINTRPVVLY